MATIRDLLKMKGNEVWYVSPTTSVLETLKVMADKDVGALLVLDADQIVGIISERDFARSIAKTEQCLLNTTVQEYMTNEVVTITPDQSVDEGMQLMTLYKIRHLPVLEGQVLSGVISIGDLVKEIISSKESTIDSLQNFIVGRGYGH
jgi:CBS domain-containing protein